MGCVPLWARLGAVVQIRMACALLAGDMQRDVWSCLPDRARRGQGARLEKAGIRGRIIMLAVTILAFAGGVAMADPLVGTWQTEPVNGAFAHVAIAPCGANVCSKIVRTYKDGVEFTSRNKGKTPVIDMAPHGGGTYGGLVWRPGNDKIYRGKIALYGDSMRLSGCVAGGLLCSRQTWAPVN